MEYYRRNISETLEEVGSSASGLTSAEVDNRLAKEGYNELKGKAKDPLWKLFLENFKDPMVIVLLIAATVQIVMGHIMESVIIFVVLILNAVISVVQTRKAESSLDALRKCPHPKPRSCGTGPYCRFRPGSWSGATSSSWRLAIMCLRMDGLLNPGVCGLTRAC